MVVGHSAAGPTFTSEKTKGDSNAIDDGVYKGWNG
jgi:hypothetical protein